MNDGYGVCLKIHRMKSYDWNECAKCDWYDTCKPNFYAVQELSEKMRQEK